MWITKAFDNIFQPKKVHFLLEVDICCICVLHFSTEVILSVFDSRTIASFANWKVCFSRNWNWQRRAQFLTRFTLMLPWSQSWAEKESLLPSQCRWGAVSSKVPFSPFQVQSNFTLQIFSSKFCSSSVHLTFHRLTAPSSAPHLHNKVFSRQWQRKFGSFLAAIFPRFRAHFVNVWFSQFFTCVFRVVGDGAGAPAPLQCLLAAPLPCSIFFWQHPENRLWSAAPHPPCFLTGFRRRQRRTCHTHTHMGHNLPPLALIG